MDPVTMEVISYALRSIAEEMGAVLVRSAVSTGIRHRRDFSTAIYTADGKLAVQAGQVPLHLGLMSDIVDAVLKTHPVPTLKPGDSIIINDPYSGGSHLPEICTVSPVFFNSRLLALVATLARHAEVGGAAPGSMFTVSEEIFQEGIRIPPLKIMAKGELNTDIFSLLAGNIRTGHEFAGDLRAQFAANRLAEKRLREFAGKYGPEKIKRYLPEILDHSERLMRSALKKLPAGEYHCEDTLEGDGLSGDSINIKAAVRCEGECITVDFTGTHPQVAGPVNTTRGVTLACVYYAVRSAVAPGAPFNAGMIRPIAVITPEGSLVNAKFPAPVAHGTINAARRIADIIFGCLAGILPGKIPEAGSGSVTSLTFGGFDPQRGAYYSFFEICGGGRGAKPFSDGPGGVHVNMTNVAGTPVEVIEQYYPLMVRECGLISGSGGPGKFRGGLGVRKTFTVLGDSAVISASAEAGGRGPRDLRGGMPGSAAVVTVRYSQGRGGKVQDMESGKFTVNLEKGDSITIKTAGGRGFGDPLERDPAAVRFDVLEGFITRDQAFDIYGVVLEGEDLQVDLKATGARRAALAQGETIFCQNSESRIQNSE
ncbi:MAG: hydantoinase B/oxoprolinase family protein [Bacillota bacterium]